VRDRSWLTPNLKVLSAVSLMQDAASELLYPILPLFLTVTLGAPPSAVGAVEGVAEGVAALTKLQAGRLADRFRKKPLIAAGYGLAALGKLLVAVATAWPVVLLGRAVDRVGKGVRSTPRDALLMVEAPPWARGRVFGFHRMADNLGAVIGPAIGLLLLELLDHRLRPLLLVALVPAVLSVLLVVPVREGPPPARHVPAHERGPLPPAVRRLVALLAVFALVNFPDALLLLRAHELGLSASAVVGAYLLYNAVATVLAYPAGALSDHLPRHVVFGVGLLLFAVGYLGLGLADEGWHVFVLLPLYGGFAALTDGVGKAWVSSLVPDGHHGAAQGLYQSVSGVGVLVAGIWAGLAWGGDGTLPLLVSGSAGLAVGLVVLAVGHRFRPVT
jgi:MFS family permease